MSRRLIPAEPGWTIVIASEGGYSSRGAPDDPDWTVEFIGLEVEQLPIVAWSLVGTALPYVVRDVQGEWAAPAWQATCVEQIDPKEVDGDYGFIVGLFHPDHRPAPDDLEHAASEVGARMVRAEQRRELWAEQRAGRANGVAQ